LLQPEAQRSRAAIRRQMKACEMPLTKGSRLL
jgi:hypothetical protein